MTCEQVRELLSAYLDKQLARAERHQVAIHLQGCNNCRSILADYQHFDALLHQLPRVAPLDTMRDRLFFTHHCEQSSSRPHPRRYGHLLLYQGNGNTHHKPGKRPALKLITTQQQTPNSDHVSLSTQKNQMIPFLLLLFSSGLFLLISFLTKFFRSR